MKTRSLQPVGSDTVGMSLESFSDVACDLEECVCRFDFA